MSLHQRPPHQQLVQGPHCTNRENDRELQSSCLELEGHIAKVQLSTTKNWFAQGGACSSNTKLTSTFPTLRSRRLAGSGWYIYIYTYTYTYIYMYINIYIYILLDPLAGVETNSSLVTRLHGYLVTWSTGLLVDWLTSCVVTWSACGLVTDLPAVCKNV